MRHVTNRFIRSTPAVGSAILSKTVTREISCLSWSRWVKVILMQPTIFELERSHFFFHFYPREETSWDRFDTRICKLRLWVLFSGLPTFTLAAFLSIELIFVLSGKNNTSRYSTFRVKHLNIDFSPTEIYITKYF